MDVLNFRVIPVKQLAADYKYRGLAKHLAWDQLIIDHGLVPGIDAKEFYKIFDEVIACPIRRSESSGSFKPTHIDTMFNRKCSLTIQNGVTNVIWDNGVTGSYPPCYPPEAGRFVELKEDTE